MRLCIGLAVGSLFVSPVRAQVIEIAQDGSFSTYDRPAVYSSEGVTRIGVVQTTQSPSPAPIDVRAEIGLAAQRHSLSPQVVEAVAWTESRFRQDAKSSAGAVGVMQLMDGTAHALGVDRYDLRQNIEGGAIYLRQMLDRYDNDLTLALAAYNAGPGAVDRHRGVPPFNETRTYVQTILSRLDAPPAVIPPFVIQIAP